MANIAKPSLIFSANSEKLDKDLDKAQQRIDKFFRQSTKKLDDHKNNQAKGGGMFGSIGGGLTSGMGGMGGMMAGGPAGLIAGAVAAITSAGIDLIKTIIATAVEGIKTLSEHFDKASKAAKSLGATSLESFLGLGHAANLAGVDAAEFEKAMGFLRRKTSGPIDEELLKLSDKLKGMANEGDQARLAVEMLGKGGIHLLPMLTGGSEELKAMQKDALDLGTAITAVQGERIERANDAITRVKDGLRGALTKFLVAAAPLIEKVANALTNVLIKIGPAIEKYARYLRTVWTVVIDGAEAIFGAIGEFISSVMGGLEDVFGSMGDLPSMEVVLVEIFRTIAKASGMAFDAMMTGAAITAGAIANIGKALMGVASLLRELVNMAKGLPAAIRPDWVDGLDEGLGLFERKGKIIIDGLARFAKRNMLGNSEHVGKVTLNPLMSQGYFVGHEQDTDVERYGVPDPAHG